MVLMSLAFHLMKLHQKVHTVLFLPFAGGCVSTDEKYLFIVMKQRKKNE
jgi:hypothetical protein